jgi:tetratricopeptide (TPR) repeat protein
MRVSRSYLMPSQSLLLVLHLVIFPSWLLGHGDVHNRIDVLDKAIRRNPADARLYLQRAELWSIEKHWSEALEDLDRAAGIDPEIEGLAVTRGRVYLESGRHREALEILTRHLEAYPDQGKAWVYRARARAGLGDVAGGADDLDRALDLQTGRDPDLFVERARILMSGGRSHWGRALSGLEDGLARFGSVVTLELLALDLEIELGRLDDALSRVERVTATLPRKENWWLRKAEILSKAGRSAESRLTYEEVLAAVGRLPDRLRKLPSTRELQSQACAGLLRLTLLESSQSDGQAHRSAAGSRK